MNAITLEIDYYRVWPQLRHHLHSYFIGYIGLLHDFIDENHTHHALWCEMLYIFSDKQKERFSGNFQLLFWHTIIRRVILPNKFIVHTMKILFTRGILICIYEDL